MPIGISSNRPRTAAPASRNLGYHASGVAILRPSANVTTSSSAVKATATGRISPTSISKVLMPFAFQQVALRSQVADNSADFMGRKSRIDGDRKVMQPEFGFEIARPDMNMRRLTALVRIEERAIWSQRSTVGIQASSSDSSTSSGYPIHRLSRNSCQADGSSG